MPTFTALAQNKQTTGLGHVTKSDMSKTLVSEPPKQLIQEFSNIVDPIYERILLGLQDSRALSKTRDYLLPRLMTAEARVRDAEAIAERADT